MTKFRLLHAIWLVPWLMLASACNEDFTPFNEIEGLRVLAVRAEPPTVGVGESVDLTPLVYLEAGDLQDVSYRWTLCPYLDPNDARACANRSDVFSGVEEGSDASLGEDLGEGATATFTFTEEMAELYASVCSGSAQAVAGYDLALVNCEGGFPMNVLLTVRHGEDEVVTFKEVRLALDDLTERNTNPALLDEVFVAEQDGEDDKPPRGDVALVNDGELALDQRYRLFLVVDEAASETFLDEKGNTDEPAEEREENLYVTWFVSVGETHYGRTSLVPSQDDTLPLDENTWELPSPLDEEATEADLYFVLRDERGGVDWIERHVRLSR